MTGFPFWLPKTDAVCGGLYGIPPLNMATPQGTKTDLCESGNSTLPPNTQVKMNTTKQKTIEAIASVLRTGVQDTPPECESNRMKHERIAQLIATEMRVRGLKNVDAWAVYEGDKKFSYALRSGKYIMNVKLH